MARRRPCCGLGRYASTASGGIARVCGSSGRRGAATPRPPTRSPFLESKGVIDLCVVLIGELQFTDWGSQFSFAFRLLHLKSERAVLGR